MAVLTQMGTEMPRKNHCPPSSPVSMGWVMWGQGDKPGAIHKLDKCSTKEPHPNPKRPPTSNPTSHFYFRTIVELLKSKSPTGTGNSVGKGSLYKHEDLGLDASTTVEVSMGRVHLESQHWGGAETGDPWELTSQRVQLKIGLQSQRRDSHNF